MMDYNPTREKKMISTPINWPTWPRLPLKHRRRGIMEKNGLGFLLQQSKTPPWIVYVGMMFMPPGSLPTERYESVEALMQDWRVD